ncbi:hypothetical protein TIFTF001_007520 [Ficus carica]|uniref:Uncharacterized protein n=1 Tax=Ficus carica TaxID=3494 RepID=A0AA87ZLE5_FICCA|nr:hypothetical protein TIFTF001_007520 [Ficus carica]
MKELAFFLFRFQFGEVSSPFTPNHFGYDSPNHIEQKLASQLGDPYLVVGRHFINIAIASRSNSSCWSLVSKMMIKVNKVSCEEVINKLNEFASTDAALNLLIVKKSDCTSEENAQIELQKLEMCIQDLEEGVESLYRRLIKTRVSLFNILNH